jgi:hypothetical protein
MAKECNRRATTPAGLTLPSSGTEIEISLFPLWEQFVTSLPRVPVLLYGLAHG